MVPTYNESGNIERLIKEILAQGDDVGVVVVDDDSPDGTWKIVEEYSKRDPRVHLLRRIGRRGRGTAGIEGFQYAVKQGVEFIIEMDADFSHKPSYISSFLKEMKDCDLLIGSRMVKGGGERGRGPLRQLITKGANLYIRLMLGLPYKDATSGFRIFRREVFEAVDLNNLISTGTLYPSGNPLHGPPKRFQDQGGSHNIRRQNSRPVHLQFKGHAPEPDDDTKDQGQIQ